MEWKYNETKRCFEQPLAQKNHNLLRVHALGDCHAVRVVNRGHVIYEFAVRAGDVIPLNIFSDCCNNPAVDRQWVVIGDNLKVDSLATRDYSFSQLMESSNPGTKRCLITQEQLCIVGDHYTEDNIELTFKHVVPLITVEREGLESAVLELDNIKPYAAARVRHGACTFRLMNCPSLSRAQDVTVSVQGGHGPITVRATNFNVLLHHPEGGSIPQYMS